MTGRMLERLEEVLLELRPDLVYGDTNSTLAGALPAAKLHIPVAHVEAELRSFNRRMPEEINRVLTDHLLTLLFCPSGTAVENLGAEGITNGASNVGDVMYDVLRLHRDHARKSLALEKWGLREDGYALCTLHRAENTDDRLRLVRILKALATLHRTSKLIFRSTRAPEGGRGQRAERIAGAHPCGGTGKLPRNGSARDGREGDPHRFRRRAKGSVLLGGAVPHPARRDRTIRDRRTSGSTQKL